MQPPSPRFGIAIPQAFGKEPVDVSLIRSFLKKADALGYHSLWVQEVLDASLLEPASLLTFAAALTRNVRLGSAVLLTTLRIPLQIAKAFATLDQLSQGRLIFGAALGSNTQNYPAYGIAAEKRLRRFVEGIGLIKKLWTEERVTHDGEYWQLHDETLDPKPVQRPHPPIWLGGSHPNALRRAVRIADGWIGGRTAMDKFKTHVIELKHILEESDRDPDDFMIGKRIYIAVDAKRTRAEQRLNQWFSEVYRASDIAGSAAIFGGQQECIDKLGEAVAAGAKLLILNPISDHLEQLEGLATNVLPKISSTWKAST